MSDQNVDHNDIQMEDVTHGANHDTSGREDNTVKSDTSHPPTPPPPLCCTDHPPTSSHKGDPATTPGVHQVAQEGSVSQTTAHSRRRHSETSKSHGHRKQNRRTRSSPIHVRVNSDPLYALSQNVCPTCLRRVSRHSSCYPPENVTGDGTCKSCEYLIPSKSLSSLLGEDVTDDNFQEEVAHKSQTLLIGRQEAELETLIDRLIAKHGDKEKALLHVIETFPSEAKVNICVNTLLHRGANPSTCDPHWRTPLHHAVRRGFKGVCGKLLENDALPHVRDKDNNMPYHIALNNNNDDIAAMLLHVMPHYVVRKMYVANDTAGITSECSFHELIENDMQESALGVLDAMLDPMGDTGQTRVFYHVLDVDRCGRTPAHPEFNPRDKSCFQRISQLGLKSIVFHDVVRLLIRRKWKLYARVRFHTWMKSIGMIQKRSDIPGRKGKKGTDSERKTAEFGTTQVWCNALVFCITQICLTFALVVASTLPDPAEYYPTGPLTTARAATEIFSGFMATLTLILELNQMRKHRLEYWRDPFNWIDLGSSCLLLAVIPLRFTHTQQHWHVFSVGYLLWTLRLFKYAAVFRKTGAYALILWRIVSEDFLQFVLFFVVILLAFTGAFVLALRGENSLGVHHETSTYWNVMFTGVRTLIEAYAVVDYAGADGYPPLSCFLMVVFLFVCCVVLLSILIAQLSDTYQHVQRDAQRGLELNRAWIITRVELNSIYIGKGSRLKTYIEHEELANPRELLRRWDGPELSQMNKNIRDLWEHLNSNRMTLLTIQARMTRQENTLIRIHESLERIHGAETRDGAKRSSSSSHD